jgi:hypothetical protein
MVKVMRTNWREIRREIIRQSQTEDCMIPMRGRIFVKHRKK